MPGRLDRLADPPPATLSDLAGLLVDAISSLEGRPEVTVLGHSFGAVVAFEVARGLARSGRAPRRLVLSAALPPHLENTERRALADWDDERLVHHVFGMGGTPTEVRGDAELERMLVSAFRNDLNLLDRHDHVSAEPLAVPTTVFTGSADLGAPLAGLRRWQDLVAPPLRLHVLPGGHFFPWSEQGFVSLLLDELERG